MKFCLREDGVDDLRNDRVFVADDAGEERFVRLQAGDEVRAHLVFHAAGLQTCFRKLIAGAQFPQGLGKRVSCGIELAPVPARPNRCVYSRRA